MRRNVQIPALVIFLLVATFATAFVPANATAANKQENDKAVQTVILKRLTDDGILTNNNGKYPPR